MRRSAALIALAMPTLFLPGCEVRHDAGPHVERIRPPATESRWSRHADISVFDDSLEIDLVLELLRDHRFELTIEAAENGDVDRDTVRGEYRWDGATLIVRGDDGETRRFHLRGDELVLDVGWTWDAVRAIAWLPELTLIRDG